MSRSGYSDDCENVQLWRGAVDQATFGKRGQALLRRLREALDAMPTKRLIANAIINESGDVCALGALDLNAPSYDDGDDGVNHSRQLAKHFGIAHALAAEIVYMNDEYWSRHETPEGRWVRMRHWVEQQIGPDKEPELP